MFHRIALLGARTRSAIIHLKMAEAAYVKMARQHAIERLAPLNLTPEEMARYEKKFDAFDLNKDGIISIREFSSVGKVFGYSLTTAEVLEIFGRRDLDDSGGITFDEFVVALRNRASNNPKLAPMRDKFKLYDVRKRGYVTADEAYPILKRELGFDMSKTEALVDMYDKNRDYKLSLLEFIEFQKRVDALKQQIIKAFRDFDQDLDGFVDLGEAKAMMLPKGCTVQQVEALFRKADADGDGKLNYTEFAAFWDIPVS